VCDSVAQRSSSGAAEAHRAEGIEKRSFSTVPWNEGLEPTIDTHELGDLGSHR